MKKIVILLALFISPLSVNAQEEILLTGMPEIKISEGGTNRTPEKLSNTKAMEYKCTIIKIGDKYYWATRGNVEMIPIQSGAFITFLASNGSGYVRIILDPEANP